MKIEIIAEDEKLIPKYATEGSAGCDLRSAEKEFRLAPGQTKKVRTGIRIAIPNGYEGQVRSRSGLGSQGIIVAHGVGTIDSDYRGEILVLLKNTSKRGLIVKKYDRIAQIVFTPVFQATFETVEHLDKTDREDKGFGSTDISDELTLTESSSKSQNKKKMRKNKKS